MRTKISLLVSMFRKDAPIDSDHFFKFLVDDKNKIPSIYISTKDEKETLTELFEKHLTIYFDWATIKLIDFRKSGPTECEAIYSCKLFDIMGVEKNGKFVSQNSDIKLDKYYEQILSERIRSTSFWSN